MINNITNSINKRHLINRKKVLIFFGVLIIVFTGVIILKSRGQKTNSKVLSSITTSSTSIENSSSQPFAQVDLQANYSFTALDSKGNPASDVNFVIVRAEKTKEVLVQGKPATAKGDKAFLVLHLEIDNPETSKRYIVPVDLLRLIGENDKKFAPDIHSEAVEIQPISTKITRMGFVVLENQKSFLLQIGELDSEKQNLEINFI